MWNIFGRKSKENSVRSEETNYCEVCFSAMAKANSAMFEALTGQTGDLDTLAREHHQQYTDLKELIEKI